MKKIYILLLCFLGLFFLNHSISWAVDCWYNGWSIGGSLDGCLNGTDLVNANWDMRLETGVKYQIITWTTALAKLFWLLAVGAIVYGGFMMTISGGEDEKIKKWKDIVKWSLLWFLAIVMTGTIIRVIVELVFDIAS